MASVNLSVSVPSARLSSNDMRAGPVTSGINSEASRPSISLMGTTGLPLESVKAKRVRERYVLLIAVASVGLDVMRPKSSLVMPKLTTVLMMEGLTADVKETATKLGRSLLGRFCRVMPEGSSDSISTASVNVSCSRALLRSREKRVRVGRKVSGTRVVEGSSEMGGMTLPKLSMTELAATLR